MNDIRWKQRYSNYTNMLKVLNDNLQNKEPNSFTKLEKIGLAKTFELSFELLWKLLKDYLEYEQIEIGLISPKNILKAAAAKGLLEQMDTNGDILMQAHKSRNELLHIYDEKFYCTTLEIIKNSYLEQMNKIDDFFKKMVGENE